MKRILFVDHVNRILGGAEVNLIELLSVLSRPSPDAAACACPVGSRLHDALKPLGIPLHDYSLAASLNETRFVGRSPSIAILWRSRTALKEARQRLRTIIGETQAQIVVSCTNKDHFAAAAACRHHNIPSVWWVNDIVSAEFFSLPVRAAFMWQAKRGAARIITVSDYARQVLLKAGLPESRVSVIHNGIVPERYQGGARGEFRRQLGVPEGEPLVGIAGRLTPWKGQDFFLRLAQTWCQKNPTGHFVMIGQAFNEDQAFETALRQFIQQNNLQARVHFAPFQSDMATALAGLDVLIHTSTRPEPFGRVIIEAMAAGVPVIAARAGGVPEIITHDVDGLMAEPARLDDYLAQLTRLLTSTELRQRLSVAGQKTVQDRFTLARVCRQFEQVIDQTA
jgi:glycosyltransferase involved in cell wall biosynthesis